MSINIKAFSLTLIMFIISIALHAQSLSDIKSVKVDQLTDAQIATIVQKAEEQGISKSQIPALAEERGMPAMEASKLATRINQLNSAGVSADEANSGTMAQRQLTDTARIGRDRSEADSLSEEEKKIFGYGLFHNKKLNFSPNLNIPTPQSYVIGTGDQLLIDIYGDSQQSYDLSVNPEGRVYIPNVGPINVGGSTIQAATARIKRELSSIYADLNSSNPRTFMQIRLGNIRSIQVAMVGELQNPGDYTLPSFASVFNALYAAGGPNRQGSFRNIRVFRDSRQIAEVDVYEFLMNGNQQQNVRLQDNDVIMVPAVETRVEVQGPVRREGLFEIQADEDINDLIRYAGGFKSEAYTGRVAVRRVSDQAREVADVSKEAFGSFKVKDGDIFLIGKKLERFENRVQISGAVFHPGEFALFEGMTVKDLIDKAEGLRGEAFLNRATLYRTQQDMTLEIVPVDVKGVVNGTAQDIILQREDVLHIPSKYDLKEEYYVKISGEVNRPGAFAFADNMTVEDLVLKAGGFKESASDAYIEVARRVKDRTNGQIAEIFTIDIDENLEIDSGDEEVVLEPFDHIIIRRSPGFQREKMVRVEGEVNYPGQYTISTANERISDLLKRAGGMNQFAYAKGAKLIRRTEYFVPKSDNEVRSENLREVKENLVKEEGKNTEAEVNMLNRIDKKINDKGGDISNQKGLAADEFRAERVTDVSQSDSTRAAKVEFKTQEMVGIDLLKILENPGSDQDLILQEGDILSIPKELQTIRMRGEVLFPTSARFESGKSFKGYISKAGGFTDNARKGKSYVIYANGDVKRTKNFIFFKDYPKMEPGAEIIVPEKPEREPMSATNWIGLASSLATLGILIDRLAE
ncbi:SLBB domain-containing protein [Echinicola vietnamensis]|uniref:Periplasmic protein involved in polysaccharide export n=1 Tax=Echinicola vietnamensis (strain DSM 17526 / LMG 23754 / KMM 6221) TaxID=926556 RepID=L0G6H2_ECHVK|nr:SLBB domain-containing protein [Echinicola vietnamensis]AGA80586.1 periplasmic protein involved in polysaccharide export [Echinicola vietnamensis DSM 17526]